jgi:hypothetical protein
MRCERETKRRGKSRWVARGRSVRVDDARADRREPRTPALSDRALPPRPRSRSDLGVADRKRARRFVRPISRRIRASLGREGAPCVSDASMYVPNPREFHLPAMPTLRPPPPPPYAPGDLPRSSARGGSRDLERDRESRPRGGGERERSLPRSGEPPRSPSGASARSGVGERGGASSPLIFLPMKRGASVLWTAQLRLLVKAGSRRSNSV